MEPEVRRELLGVTLAWTLAVVAPTPALAQQTSTPNTLSKRLWLVAGTGFSAARAGCAECDREGVVTHSRPIMVDAGVHVTTRVDAGLELYWARLKVNGEQPIETTFAMGVVQMKPWVDRGLFVRAGMGIGVAGNGLYSHLGPVIAAPYTTNSLALNFGVGWKFALGRRLALQVHAMQHVAAVGELTTAAGVRIRNVVGNYWTVGWAIVIR
jgi:hypothetical protein